MPASAKVLPVLFATTGILSVLLGGLRMTMLPRGFAAAGIGLAPLMYSVVSPSFEWQGLLEIIGTVTLVPGLLVRSQYTGARIARIMVTVGAVCVILPQIIPDHGQVPLVSAFKALGSNQTVEALFMLFPVVLALVSLIAWTPPPGRAAGHILAWIWITYGLAAALVLLLAGGHVGETLKSSLSEVLYIPLGHMAWVALVGYGAASVVGKQLE
jgi:hypothetical protein